MMPLVIGIDAGTGSTKALLMDVHGKILARHAVQYPIYTPEVGYSEQCAQDWWQAVVACVRSVCATGDIASRVKGLALSTQGGTMVPVDRELAPLGRAVVWNDRRCDHERQEFMDRFGEELMYQTTGWGLGAGLPALVLRHLRRQHKDICARAHMYLSVHDFLAARLTGRAAVDLSNAGINQLINIREGRYCRQLTQFAMVEERQLPELIPSGCFIGTLTASAAEALGLPEDVVLSSGAHDQYAVSLGAGIVNSGDAVIGTGTAWVVTVLQDTPDFDSGFAQSIPAVAGKWGSMISISNGGVSLDWFRKKVACANAEALSYDTINDTVSRQFKPGAQGLCFYPYFGGANCPIRNHQAKATFFGLDLSHGWAHFAQAIMEGIVYQIAWALERMHAHRPIHQITVAGGALKSPVWLQMIANILNRTIYITDVDDLACVGAAMLATVGSNLYPDVVTACRNMSPTKKQIEPQAAEASEYAGLFRAYKKQAQDLFGF